MANNAFTKWMYANDVFQTNNPRFSTIFNFWTLEKKIYIYIYRMDNNELLMIVLAFVVGYMCNGMMRQIVCRPIS